MSGISGSNSKGSKSSDNGGEKKNEEEEEEEEEVLFRQGSRVEVSSNDKGLIGVWFVGTIVEAEPTNSSSNTKNKNNNKKKKEMVVVVEYDNLLADEHVPSPLKEKVKISFIRPVPPAIHSSSSSAFEKDDLVDAFHRDGWWVGVITKVIGDEDSSLYEVFFKDPPEFLICHSSVLRLHLDWVQGKWIRPPKSHPQSPPLLLDMEKQKVGAPETEKVKRIKVHAKKSKAGILGGASSAGGKKSDTTGDSQDEENNGPKGVEGSQKRKRGRPPLQGPNVSAKRAVVASPGVADATASKETSSSETNLKTKEVVQVTDDNDVVFGDLTPLPGQQQAVSSPQTNMNDPSWNSSPCFSLCVCLSVAYSAAAAGKEASSSQTSLKTKENDAQVTDDDVVLFGDLTPLPGEQEGRTPPQTFMNDRRVSDAGSGTNINQLEASDRPKGNATDAALSTTTNNNILNLEKKKKNNWPFVKCSPLWQTIESTSIFQKTAGTLHFSSLDRVEEVEREGLAIGYTVTFATMLENISKLVISDPTTTTIIERYLRRLAELEEHGFNVEEVRVCLNDLLSIKAKETRLQDESKEVKGRLAQCHLEKKQLADKQSEIEAKLRELQEEHQAIALNMDLKDQEIAALKSKEELINQGITTYNLDFQTRASASPL